MADDKILSLDELFGESKKIKVKWLGQEHELLSMQNISPKQAMKLQHLQEKVGTLKVEGEPSDEDVEKMESLLDEMLQMIGSSLPIAEIPFAGKLAIVKFYVEQTQEKKALKVAPVQPIGATLSAE